ncbi:copper resistance protein D [Bordetella bronchiseptica 99-R-0433]|uniref:CopD family protein n=1 Tax=Bordetella bronchiseptica TaxID=518 RepID=UPI00045A4205|nr:CopD family protein [Bordetella bronchiseptica]KCV66638.1 copper resistance protein D [Bordetella bronchiseptica 99-R-0433]
MLYASLKFLHLLSIILWVGGMAFAHCFLRPAVAALEPPARLRLMHDVLGRFLRATQYAVLIVLATGAVMMAQATGAGLGRPPVGWHVMAGLGLLMALVFVHVRYVLFRRLAGAVAAQDWPAGGAAMARIRGWVAFNLALAVVILAVLMLA